MGFMYSKSLKSISIKQFTLYQFVPSIEYSKSSRCSIFILHSYYITPAKIAIRVGIREAEHGDGARRYGGVRAMWVKS